MFEGAQVLEVDAAVVVLKQPQNKGISSRRAPMFNGAPYLSRPILTSVQSFSGPHDWAPRCLAAASPRTTRIPLSIAAAPRVYQKSSVWSVQLSGQRKPDRFAHELLPQCSDNS